MALAAKSFTISFWTRPSKPEGVASARHQVSASRSLVPLGLGARDQPGDDALAWQLIAPAEGLGLQWLLDPSSPDMASGLRLFLEGVSSEKR